MLAPTETPTKRLTSTLMTAPLLPTAAMAWLLSNRPTTATSAELNSCCRMVLAASGNANRTILSHRDPCSMSI